MDQIRTVSVDSCVRRSRWCRIYSARHKALCPYFVGSYQSICWRLGVDYNISRRKFILSLPSFPVDQPDHFLYYMSNTIVW
jgi:hypothetical protein